MRGAPTLPPPRHQYKIRPRRGGRTDCPERSGRVNQIGCEPSRGGDRAEMPNQITQSAAAYDESGVPPRRESFMPKATTQSLDDSHRSSIIGVTDYTNEESSRRGLQSEDLSPP